MRAPVKVLIVSPQGEQTRIAVLKPKIKSKEDVELKPEVKQFLESRKAHPKFLAELVRRTPHAGTRGILQQDDG